MGDAQGGRVGVDPVGYHAVINRPAGRNLVAGQQTHDARIPVVELEAHGKQKVRRT